MRVQELGLMLVRAWSAETSASPLWSESNPALGQCAVTALIIQDHLGGDLLRVVNDGESHYFNRMTDGTWMDLTRPQFKIWVPSVPEVREREYVLSFPDTARRYNLLRERIESRR